MSTRNFFYDTEFLEDGKTIELISIGIVSGTDEYYAVNADCNFGRIVGDDWLWKNVCPSLPTTKTCWTNLNQDRNITGLDRHSALVRPKWVIANEVRDFITHCLPQGDKPQLWADYGAYDHVALAQLWGKMTELPIGIPMWTNDIRQLIQRMPGTWREPKQAVGMHNALEDARHAQRIYQSAMNVIGSNTP